MAGNLLPLCHRSWPITRRQFRVVLSLDGRLRLPFAYPRSASRSSLGSRGPSSRKPYLESSLAYLRQIDSAHEREVEFADKAEMVRFIRYWIERNMEDPAAREEKHRKRLERAQKGAVELKKRWDTPLLPAGYWNLPGATSVTRERLAEAEAEIISPYARALADMDIEQQRKAK